MLQIQYYGDKKKAQEHRGLSLMLLQKLENMKSLGKLDQIWAPVHTLKDGTTIKMESIYDSQRIFITSPFVYEPEKPVEELPEFPELKYEEKLQVALFTYYMDVDWNNLWTLTGVYKDRAWTAIGNSGTPVPFLYVQKYDSGGYFPAYGWSNNDGSMAVHRNGNLVTAIPGWAGGSGVALVQVSKNFGASWGEVISMGAVSGEEVYVSTDIDPEGNIYVLVAATYNEYTKGQQIYKSTNDGDTFTLLTSQTLPEDYTAYSPNLTVNSTDWAYGANSDTGKTVVNKSGVLALYGDDEPHNPYFGGAYVNPNATSLTVWGKGNALPQVGLAESGTLCVVDSVYEYTIIAATPYYVEDDAWYVVNPFTGVTLRENATPNPNSWEPASTDSSVGCIVPWPAYSRTELSAEPLEFYKIDNHAVIARNGTIVWDAAQGDEFYYWGIPSEIRNDGTRWVASFMNMNSVGRVGAVGDTWGILVSEDDGVTWAVKAVTGITIRDNSAYPAYTTGGKCSVDIDGKKIVVTVAQIDRLQMYVSKNLGSTWRKLLDRTLDINSWWWSDFQMSVGRFIK